ncbi:MAG: NDP-sugar synthase [Actinomycetia bacterium]|nr:NDP-sugar synthase [Actinomycetes bacterium]
MKAVILVGGRGTRLRPVTYLNPKPMLPLMNRPFMYSFVSWLKSHGLTDIIFSTCYLPEIFNDYFDDGKNFGLELTYITEESPLGTCGAVKNVEGYLDGEPFMVFNGDILTSLDLAEMKKFHREKGADITISLTPVDDPTAYGLVPIDNEDRVKEFLEKPGTDQVVTNLINAGTYMIEPHMLDLAPKGEKYSFERGRFPQALQKGYKVYGYVSNAYWLDVGTPEKYLAAHHDIALGKIKYRYPYPELRDEIFLGENIKYSDKNFKSGPVVIGDGTVIEPGASILPLTVIGNNCRINTGARISGAVIFDNCTIGRNCHITDSIISHNVRTGENVSIKGLSVIGDNTVIQRDNMLARGIKVNINSAIEEGQIEF